MMAFTMPFFSACKKLLIKPSPGSFLPILLCLYFAAVPLGTARADEPITVLFATLKPTEDSWVVDAAFNIRLNRTQEDALKKGIPLHFITEVKLERVRGWWLNEDLAAVSRSGRLNFSPLTRRYQVESAEGFKAYDTMPEALAELGRIEKWAITPYKTLKPGNSHVAAIRMRIDLGQLSKPLQVNAFASGKWDFEGGWYEWEVTP